MIRNQEQDGWHLDKRIPIGIIVTLLMYGIAGLWVIADIKKDVEVLKAQRLDSEIRLDKITTDVKEGDNRINSRLDTIESKLDRLIERGNGK